MTLLQAAPRLWSLKMEGTGFPCLDLHIFPLGWGTLTNLDLGFLAFYVSDSLRLLALCTRLERVNFVTEGPADVSVLWQPPVRLPQLTALEWFGLRYNGISLFRRFSRPHPETLTLRDASAESPAPLTKFHGTIWDLEVFTAAANLTEMICKFEPDDDVDFTLITHRNLRSLTLSEDSADVIPYLALPALQHLDISAMDSSSSSLGSFLARCSPALVSLSVRRNASESCFDYLHDSMSFVASTLESLKIHHMSDEDIRPLLELVTPLTSLHTLSFSDLDGGSELHFLINFLYARFEKLRTFKLIWRSSPFLDAMSWAGWPGTPNELDAIGGHLWQLVETSMDIYLGTVYRNYASLPT
ncbi:hypothetical protein MSAN_00356100 [Mycena sanguinolenta]|uniref:Uncharacterized protein n=1 Tax=Mycena sanguinolenta TaxID=230812 RepID=A0A8H7DGL9_9AGAR|nr:hypothetical protein MSAN_00356100 [Mycena sanguinolenta]